MPASTMFSILPHDEGYVIEATVPDGTVKRLIGLFDTEELRELGC